MPDPSANVDELKKALSRDEIVACFQPIVELANRQLMGFEVLARWRHPHHGLVLPQNFVLSAHESGLIGELTNRILRKGLAVASLLPTTLTLAFNISPVQLSDQHLALDLRTAAEEANFPLDRIKLEITENAFLDDFPKAQRTLIAMEHMGCRLSLDDFGTGYSSLQYLHALPFDEIKIDRSFVATMTVKRQSRKIVAAIIGLGQSLDIDTVAEGIETQEQANMLLRLGCKQGQGWLYGPPVTIDSLPQVFQEFSHPAKRSSQELSLQALSSLEAHPTYWLAQLKAIYAGVPIGLCFLDFDLRYVSINSRLAEMNGATIEAHLGNTVGQMIPETFSILSPYLKRALSGEVISNLLIARPVRLRDHTVVEVSFQPAFDEDGEVIGVSAAVVEVLNIPNGR